MRERKQTFRSLGIEKPIFQPVIYIQNLLFTPEKMTIPLLRCYQGIVSRVIIFECAIPRIVKNRATNPSFRKRQMCMKTNNFFIKAILRNLPKRMQRRKNNLIRTIRMYLVRIVVF